MKQRTTGFTIVELLFVISIISFIASVVLAILSPSRAKARDAKRLSDAREFQHAFELRYADTVNYLIGPCTGNPAMWTNSCASSEWTTACPGNSPRGLMRLVQGNYINALPKDPTNSGTVCYRYRSNGAEFKFAVYMENPENQTQYAEKDGGVCATWYELFSPGAQNWNVGDSAACP